ncbi:MAG: citrate/2-methylcitrate synthase [Clostridiales Family XIII bacterium]|jgi:citrate synthase|nr:citrate/2-methylcitrate synthase [Clostridiales Family XIII bacterium]
MLATGFNTLDGQYSEITPEIEQLARLCIQNGLIDAELYTKHRVNRGLRDLNGNGVLTGLTEISEIQAFDTSSGKKVPIEGKLFFRGVDVKDLVKGFIREQRSGFEECAYLLIFGDLPTERALVDFTRLLEQYRTLPTSFVRDIIMKAPNADMMNTLARSVLTLHSYDTKANDIDIANVLRQSLLLTAVFPLLSVYGYQAFRHYFAGDDLFIHTPKPGLSTAENILYMLRKDGRYTEQEARILDVALVLHAEHGGGNNSTFTTHVVSSSGTDTYSSVAASICSLKGPKHGGANIKVVQMFEDLKATVKDRADDEEVERYLRALLHGEAFDKAGLIYGMGHAIYSLSDPRADIFKYFVENLAEEKGRSDEYKLYNNVQRLAAKVIADERKIYKGVSANIDFYSGFVYSMLDLPLELYTPIFAIARIAGWSAHRIEELINAGKIIRPAYRNVLERTPYIPIAERSDQRRIRGPQM